jgi:hypothetical protein
MLNHNLMMGKVLAGMRVRIVQSQKLTVLVLLLQDLVALKMMTMMISAMTLTDMCLSMRRPS